MKIRVGILGCANIARRSLAPAFHAHGAYDLVAIASRDMTKAEAFAKGYKARPCLYENLITAKDIDLIYCPLPTGLHYEYVLRCLQNGKHVLCEKSLATSYAEVCELVDLARRNRLLLMESFQFRFHEQNLFVRQLLSSQKLGDVRQLVVRFGFPPFPDGHSNIRYSKDLGGGALLDAGAYTLKAASYLLGGPLTVRTSNIWSQPNEEVDIGGSVELVSDQGAPASLAYGFDNAYQCGYDIWCEKGIVRTERAFTAPPGFAASVEVKIGQAAETHVFKADHFHALLDYVAKTLHDGLFDAEYAESLVQSRLLDEVRKAGGL